MSISSCSSYKYKIVKINASKTKLSKGFYLGKDAMSCSICQMRDLIQRKKHIHIIHVIFPDKMADLRDAGIG